MRTGRTGAAAKAGHDLLFHVTDVGGDADVGDEARRASSSSADGASLQRHEGTGGMQSLGDDDRASIEQTIDDEVLKRQAITFRSTATWQQTAGERAARSRAS